MCCNTFYIMHILGILVDVGELGAPRIGTMLTVMKVIRQFNKPHTYSLDLQSSLVFGGGCSRSWHRPVPLHTSSLCLMLIIKGVQLLARSHTTIAARHHPQAGYPGRHAPPQPSAFFSHMTHNHTNHTPLQLAINHRHGLCEGTHNCSFPSSLAQIDIHTTPHTLPTTAAHNHPPAGSL
jgi:hypothetical protein